ncbi:Protein FAR1-RELATED SEQUENCE 5, partial [Linum perenne]
MDTPETTGTHSNDGEASNGVDAGTPAHTPDVIPPQATTGVQEDELVKLRYMTYAEVKALIFSSSDDGEKRYRKYAYTRGFGVRIGKVYCSKKGKLVKHHWLNQLHNMIEAGMSQSLAYKYMVHTSGGHDQVGFTNKDVHNQLYRESTSKDSDHDVKAALSYLDKKKLKDAKFVMKYTKDDEGRLDNIFWTDSMSITDYTSFGEVLAFDTTYKKNAYNMPLVEFSESNAQANIEEGGDVNNIDEGGAVNDIDEGGAVNDIEMSDDNTIDIDDDNETSEEENDDDGLDYNSPSDIEEQ